MGDVQVKSRTVICALAMLFVLLWSAQGRELDTNLAATIECQIQQLKSQDGNEGRRAEIAASMFHNMMVLREEKRIEEIEDGTIGELVSLLDDGSDAVRSWTAGTLGLLGPRARIAIPALQRALKRIEDENRRLVEGEQFTVRGPDSEAAIQLALRRISGLPDN
jgi:hypothetical protein